MDSQDVNTAEVVFNKIIETCGQVDILVNNAGVLTYHSISNEDEKTYDDVSFGAHFIDYLKNSEIKTWLYPAESLSKNIILEKDCVKITPSSFDLNPIKIINL